MASACQHRVRFVRTDHCKAAVVGLAVLAAVQVYVGRSLMARLVAEELPLTVTAGLEPTPTAENSEGAAQGCGPFGQSRRTDEDRR
jgi:hypothetical protein